MVENYYSAIDFVNWFADISTPSWAILGLTSQSVFGRCCTTGHLGSTERSSSNNAGGWEGPRICCWWFLLGTKCLWSHVWRQREKPHKKVSCVLEVSLCLTASGIGFSSALTHVRTRFRPLEIRELPEWTLSLSVEDFVGFQFSEASELLYLYGLLEAKCPGRRSIFGRLVQANSKSRDTVDRLDVL